MVSIIIPTFNRCDMLRKALMSLRDIADFDRLVHEVIVVDNHSTDATRQLVESLSATFNGKLRYLFEPAQGKSFAVNNGMQAATQDVLAFIDDDEVVDKDWLKNLWGCLNDSQADLVAGRVLPVFPPRCSQWVKDNAIKFAGAVLLYDYGETDRKVDATMYLPGGGNFIMRRKVTQDCGVFRTDLGPGKGTVGEDSEFMARVLKTPKHIHYCGGAVVWHPVDPARMTLVHIAKWHIQLGTYFARVEFEDKTKHFISFFGVPRYLFRGIAFDAFRLLLNCFNKLGFFNAWRGFFCKIGMIREYRALRTRGDG